MISNKTLWCYPLVVIAAQLLPLKYSLIIGLIFFTLGLTNRFRLFLLFGFAIFGHLAWSITSQQLDSSFSDTPLSYIFSRFGLAVHIILLIIWSYFQPCANSYLRFGKMKETLKFPLVWLGTREYIWRFTLVFCALWLIVTIFFSLNNSNMTEVLLYGFLFAAINSVIEEVLWRGLILGRIVDYIDEKQGLILSSIAFGFYHLSLGFSIWVCLAFATGGFYMGGITIKSKGLFAPIVMHFFVNMAFVSIGIIF